MGNWWWLELLWHDIKESFLLWDLKDLALPTYFALWLVILFSPLVGVDRRDPYAAMVYVLFCVAAGVTLIFALPQRFTPPHSINFVIGALLSMAGISAFRWYYRNEYKVAVQRLRSLDQRVTEERKDHGKK